MFIVDLVVEDIV